LAAVVGSPGRVAADVIVSVTQVGSPTWRPADFHLFTAPSEPSSAAASTLLGILPNHTLNLQGAIAPGTPHPPPYTSEIAAGLAALGIQDRTVFRPSDLAGTPNGLWFAYMLVPNPGVTGSSPDFASGPVIPESVFPITSTVTVLRDGQPYDSGLVRSRALADLDPPFVGFTGSSHRPQFFFSDLTNADNPLRLRAADLPGQYQLLAQLRDSQGNGYNLAVGFAVADPVPDPAPVPVFAALGLPAAAGTVRRRTAPARRS